MVQNQTNQQNEKDPVQEFIEINEIPEFEDERPILLSLLHPSAIYELEIKRDSKDLLEKRYKRLANLGDTIYTAIVTSYLFETYPEDDSETLTECRKDLVNKELLLEFAQQLNITKYSLLGKSQKQIPVSKQAKLYAEMFKVFIATLYVKMGFQKTYEWLVEKCLEEKVESLYEEDDDFEFEDDEDYDPVYNSAGIPNEWLPGYWSDS